MRGDQGNLGTSVWIGVDDVEAFLEEYRVKGHDARHPPTNYPWAYKLMKTVAAPKATHLKFAR